MRIVTPYRPFPPESEEHLALGAFDWIGAIGMLRASVERSCLCETVTLTDVDTSLPGPVFQYVTTRRRLMLWILEVMLRYLESPDFDQDTVMVSPDILVLGDLGPYFKADLGVIVRSAEKFIAAGLPLLNSVQWWRVEAKNRLIAFYRQALDIAETLPEDVIRWGADTEPLLRLLSPLERGLSRRSGLTVSAIDQSEIMTSFTRRMDSQMRAGVTYHGLPLIDFKFLRKHSMREFFTVNYGAVPCNS